MKLDKKSLIQVVILIVLIAGGAGAYLMQQDGGLDFLSGFFESEQPTIRAPTTRAPATAADKAPATAPAPPATAPAPAKPAVAEIPATPVTGQLRGKPFIVENSYFESGVLGLGRAQDDVEIKIDLPGSPWETPAGKKFKVTVAGGTSLPRVMVLLKEEGKTAPSQHTYGDKVSLDLEFGAEKDKKLPGKILLTLPDESKSRIAGTFEAQIRGFRIVNGKPDLSADSVDTLQYLALRDLLKDDPNKSLELLSFQGGRTMPAEAGRNMTGYIEAEYRVGPDAPAVKRFQFEKAEGNWKLTRTLSGNQLEEAHPIQPPGAKDSPSRMLTYLSAKRLEADIQKKFPNKNIFAPEFASRHSDKFKIGVCEATYKLEPGGKTLKTAYLFRQQAGNWKFDRALADKEKVDFETGRVVSR